VYHSPASAFVLNFLGNVNLFHARVEDGKAPKVIQEDAQPDDKLAKMYVRPHQLTITRAPTSPNSIKAIISFINPAGSVVKIEATTPHGGIIQAELAQEEYRSLGLAKNDEIYLTPKSITYYEYEI